MPSPRRIERLQQVIHETAATTIQRDLSDPRLGFVTVTHVKLAPDLSLATVFWSCLGTDAERRTCERALASSRTRVQSAVAGAMGTRVTPTVRFRYDESLANAARLEDIFERLRRERGEEPGAEGEDAAAEPGRDAPPDAPPAAEDGDDEGGGDPVR
jgi:ribosome-binding factor A